MKFYANSDNKRAMTCVKIFLPTQYLVRCARKRGKILIFGEYLTGV